MGYCLSKEEMNQVLKEWRKTAVIYAPKCFQDEGAFSGTDLIRYGEITDADEVVTDQKSRFSWKEIVLPLSETLFYFTEEEVIEAAPDRKKTAIVFLRSCDLHAVKRLDEVYLNQGTQDYYYKRLRENIKFVLIGCQSGFDNCFCASMGTNVSTDYDASFEWRNDKIYINCKLDELAQAVATYASVETEVVPSAVAENQIVVHVPDSLDLSVMKSNIWEEYSARCINCGRCNFSCPTCTCYTMQDIFYTDNGKVGERRRVWASCMVDGYTDVAGGGSYRKTNGERMRFKVLHKVYDFQKRNGYHMCVGCGRCDDVCPEYISFSNCVNRLSDAMKEVRADEA